jgi:hypothetical protein
MGDEQRKGRRETDVTEWSDRRLDDRFASVDRNLSDLAAQVRVVAALVPQVAAMQVTVEGLRDDVREAIDEAKGARDAADGASKASAKGRRDTLVAVLGFAAPVTVALIGGIVTLLLGGG